MVVKEKVNEVVVFDIMWRLSDHYMPLAMHGIPAYFDKF